VKAALNDASVGEFRLDVAKRQLLGRNQQPVPLTPKAFETLVYLVRHSGDVLDKDELMRAVWPDTVVEENNLSQNVSALRRALGEKPNAHRYIVTIPGKGFSFVANVTAVAADSGQIMKTDGNLIPTKELHSGLSAKGKRLLVGGLLVAILGAAGVLIWRSSRSGSAPSPEIKVLAVLPFKPLVAENRDPALELGMADSLIAKLSNSRKLVVRPISAVRRYSGLDQDPQAAGRALGAEAVLDGYIQRQGEMVRVTARLLSVRDGRQLWARQFDERMTNIFGVQDSISERVAGALALKLSGQEELELRRRSTENVAAYQLYLRGRYFQSRRIPEDLQKGIDYFRQAIALDQNYALAYAGMADCYVSLGAEEYGAMPPSEVMPKAKDAALKALSLNDALAEAHTSLGLALEHEWAWTSSEREFKRALQLGPNYSEAHRSYALYLARLGRLDDAFSEGTRAWEIEPGSPNRSMVVGWIFYFSRQYDQAIEQYTKTLESEPNYYPVRFRLGLAYLQKRMYTEAADQLLRAAETSDRNARILAFLGYTYAVSGDRDHAVRLLHELQARSRQTYVSSYDVAIIQLGLGNRKEALIWLDRAAKERDGWVSFLKVDPVFDDLRSELGFDALARSVNLPD
jgi:DNA-binding winged helix-turn-helix (wHTH) protein/TolB-like protein/Flp pilus assembly protein TadD